MKPVEFAGSSLGDIRNFPTGARQQAGFQLHKIQLGLDPDDWKPMPAVGTGVREIRIREDGGAYRVIYVTKMADAICVLHAFKKKTHKTRKQDIDLARKRLQEILKR